MEHLIPGNWFPAPELEAVGSRPSVKPIVEGGVVTPEVVIPV